MFRANERVYYHGHGTAQRVPLRYFTHPEENSQSQADWRGPRIGSTEEAIQLGSDLRIQGV